MSEETPHDSPELAREEDRTAPRKHVPDLTSYQRDLLYVIADLPDPTGLALQEEIETYYDSNINHGRVYKNLNALEETGFVEKISINGRRNTYHLTQRAIRELLMRREWENERLPPDLIDT